MTSLDTPLNGAADWTEPGPLAPITAAEVEDLAGLEQVIEGGLVAFVAVGTALAEVRDRRLYRGEFPTFEAYCDARWGIARSRAYQMIEAAEVVSTMVDSGATVLPANERQSRVLANADPAERADVMAAVAGKGKPTAAAIADEIEARHPKPAADPEPDPSSSAAPPKPPTLRDHPEVKASERAWAPAKALGKGLRSMLPALEVMEVLPADSLESFDQLADEAIAWGKRWKEERKAATRLRLMGVKEVRR